MGAAHAPDLPLDAALLVGALETGAGELRVKEVVRAKRDEAIGLDPPPSAQDRLDR